MHVRLFFSLLVLLAWLLPSAAVAQKPAGGLAPQPLYRDPVYDGAADPVIIWNKQAKKWWMLYTNRRATDTAATGVTWVHGTRIGIAESGDGGATWTYRDTANINYRPQPGYTFWAPEVVAEKGIYHLFLTYVPGVFTDWNHPRTIVHLTSPDLLNWQCVSTLALA
ncbi:MAG: glycosyl hydrolase, partial [Cytophagaceae bacterium]